MSYHDIKQSTVLDLTNWLVGHLGVGGNVSKLD